MKYQDYVSLKKQCEQLQRDADRYEGEVRSLRKELKTEFGVSTLEEARKVFERNQKQLEKVEIRLDYMTQKFNSKYGEKV